MSLNEKEKKLKQLEFTQAATRFFIKIFPNPSASHDKI
jgi:hypothetical protein